MRLFLLLSLLGTCLCSHPARLPSRTECQQLASSGVCETYPALMWEVCGSTCEIQHRTTLLEKYGHSTIPSFYNLNATDITGNVVDFEDFRGKVTMIVNVASYCSKCPESVPFLEEGFGLDSHPTSTFSLVGSTPRHYSELVQLHEELSHSGGFEILAFPCNQFGQQEPHAPEVIKQFCDSKGVSFRVMEKIHVNGPKAHPVYKFLKHTAGPRRIQWNFATYYLISSEGKVQAYSNGESPLKLKEEIIKLQKG